MCHLVQPRLKVLSILGTLQYCGRFDSSRSVAVLYSVPVMGEILLLYLVGREFKCLCLSVGIYEVLHIMYVIVTSTCLYIRCGRPERAVGLFATQYGKSFFVKGDLRTN